MKVNNQGLQFENFVIKDKEIKDYFLKFQDDEETLKNELKKILRIGIAVVTDERLVTLVNQLEDELGVKFTNLKKLLKETEIKKLGTKKGFVFEDLLETRLNEIAKLFGDEVKATGTEVGIIPNSKKGDFVITLNTDETFGAETRIMIEAKNSGIGLIGKNGAFNELDEGKKNRDAREAFIVFTKDNSPKDAGIFRYYANHGIICEIDEERGDTLPMELAYRFLRTKVLVGLKKEGIKTVDIKRISNYLQAAYEQIKTISTLKKSITKTSGEILNLNNNLDDLKENLESIFKEIEKELLKKE